MTVKINLENGKYTVVNALSSGEGFYALRHGEKWRSLSGDGLILAMFHEIEDLRKEIKSLCPIGDLDAVSSLRAENSYLTEVLAERDELIRSLVDVIQKIRSVVKDYG